MKVSELSGSALDWAVCKASGTVDIDMMWELVKRAGVSYSTDWGYGGRVIERERISISPRDGYWEALYHDNLFQEDRSDYFQMGATPLIAAMRCYVASKLGYEIEVPEGV